jgi:hypothetical protein
MGCDQCVGRPREALCSRCAVWIYPLGLASQGPMINTEQGRHRRGGLRAPEMHEYPADFQAAYRREHAQCAADCWCHGARGVNLAALLDTVAQTMPSLVDLDDQIATDLRRRALHGQLDLIGAATHANGAP